MRMINKDISLSIKNGDTVTSFFLFYIHTGYFSQ